MIAPYIVGALSLICLFALILGFAGVISEALHERDKFYRNSTSRRDD